MAGGSGGAESGGGAQWSSDGLPHLFRAWTAAEWAPQPMGRGGGRPSWRGGGASGRGTRGEEEAGSQSGFIRFSHCPHRGSEQLGRREKRQRPGSPGSRSHKARRGPQALSTRPPRCHDAQEEGQLRRGGGQGGAQEEVGEVVSQTCSCKSGNEAKKGGGKESSLR
ncbi:non-histone chromosomal protein HMG-14 isoform 2-T2 [Molossus nigricans]